jgi:transmembrane sensor
MVDRIAALRASGRYAELADELAAAIAREPRVKTRERLSFELGSDLSYHLGDPGRACAHWEAHLRRFPSGRYTEEANDALRALHCKKEGEKEQ